MSPEDRAARACDVGHIAPTGAACDAIAAEIRAAEVDAMHLALEAVSEAIGGPRSDALAASLARGEMFRLYREHGHGPDTEIEAALLRMYSAGRILGNLLPL